MEDVERSISTSVDRFSKLLERVLVTAVRVFALPVTLPIALVKLSVPPALHIVIFLSLLPLLGLFSISAGFLVVRWIPTGWTVPAYLQYGLDATPFAFSIIKDLNTNQPYDISVHLIVPNSQSNYDLGNFMTSITLTTLNNRTVAASQKSSVLVPPSPPFSLLAPKLSTVVVPLFDSLVPTYGTLRAKLEVGRPDSWKQLGNGQGKELAVIDAYIKGNVKLRGLTALMAISPTTTGIITSVTFFFTATTIALILYFTFSPTFSAAGPEEEAKKVEGDVVGPREIKPILRRPSAEVKIEPGFGERSPLRRRRSRLSDASSTASSSRVLVG